jgi:hypothetical protein
MTRRRLLALTVTVLAAALTSTFLCKLVLDWLFTPAVWVKLFYLRWFAFTTNAGLWSAVLFPVETSAAGSALMSKPWFAPLAYLAGLAAVAAILVSCGDFAFEWAGTSATGTVLKSEMIWRRAWLTSSVILFVVYALTFALTARLATTVILISPL